MSVGLDNTRSFGCRPPPNILLGARTSGLAEEYLLSAAIVELAGVPEARRGAPTQARNGASSACPSGRPRFTSIVTSGLAQECRRHPPSHFRGDHRAVSRFGMVRGTRSALSVLQCGPHVCRRLGEALCAVGDLPLVSSIALLRGIRPYALEDPQCRPQWRSARRRCAPRFSVLQPRRARSPLVASAGAAAAPPQTLDPQPPMDGADSDAMGSGEAMGCVDSRPHRLRRGHRPQRPDDLRRA